MVKAVIKKNLRYTIKDPMWQKSKEVNLIYHNTKAIRMDSLEVGVIPYPTVSDNFLNNKNYHVDISTK